MKQEERIFICNNDLLEADVKRKVMNAFAQCGKLEMLLKDFGMPITREIVENCLTLRKFKEQVPVEGSTKWVGEKEVRFASEFAAIDAWRNDEYLRVALKEIAEKIARSDLRQTERNTKLDALENEYNELLNGIYGLFHIRLRTIETSDLLKYIDVVDGHIVLPDDIDEQIRKECATYAEKRRSKEAYRLHREIAEKMTRLSDLMKNISRNDFEDAIKNLFTQDDNGNFVAAPIDYDLYT